MSHNGSNKWHLGAILIDYVLIKRHERLKEAQIGLFRDSR